MFYSEDSRNRSLNPPRRATPRRRQAQDKGVPTACTREWGTLNSLVPPQLGARGAKFTRLRESY